MRPDVVRRVYKLVARNMLQPHGTKFSYHPKGSKAGHNNSAGSWGTGRAKARVPRVNGSGTSRAGQAAVANFARKGHMFSPICIWRRWHRLVPKKERNIAVLSCLSASSLAPLVEAKGHVLKPGTRLPLVLQNSAINKLISDSNPVKKAKKMLSKIGLEEDLKRCKEGKKLNSARSRLRNRKYKNLVGPLVIHAEKDKENCEKIKKAFGSLPGVSVMNVKSMNLKRLAPGGEVGRLVVWTEDAVKEMNEKIEKMTEKTEINRSNSRKVMNETDVKELLNLPYVKSKLNKKENLITKMNKITSF